MSRTSWAEARSGYLLISPAALLFLIFIAIPFCAALVLSFFDWDILTPATFAGFGNYQTLFGDGRVHSALFNTFVFTVSTVVLHIVLGLLLAVAVNRVAGRWLKYFLRTAYFFPALVSWAAVALLWRYALDPEFGFVNYYLRGLGVDPPNWLVDTTWALPSLVAIDLWKTLGYTFVILLAGLQTVPQHLLEAAKVDGAGPFRRFWNVTVPMLSPTLLFATIITFIGALQIFEPMYIMTKGGPDNRTLSIVQEIYYNAFRDFEMGYACALAVVLSLIIMAITLLQLRLSRMWVTYER
jgi:multiple sugar transport system permease protein